MYIFFVNLHGISLLLLVHHTKSSSNFVQKISLCLVQDSFLVFFMYLLIVYIFMYVIFLIYVFISYFYSIFILFLFYFYFSLSFIFLKKNLNAPRPSEHPPVRGKKCQNV